MLPVAASSMRASLAYISGPRAAYASTHTLSGQPVHVTCGTTRALAFAMGVSGGDSISPLWQRAPCGWQPKSGPAP